MDINTAIADRTLAGECLTEAELAELDAADVLALGMLADDVRRARVGTTVSFTRVLEAGAGGLPEGDALAPLLAAADEVRLTAPGPTLDATTTLVRATRAVVGSGRRLTGFALDDLAGRGWGPLEDVLTAIGAAGLDALAEAPVDAVSPADVRTATAAGLGPAVLSVRTWSTDRVGLIVRMRAVLDTVPSIGRVAPLARQQSVAAPSTGYHDVRMVALTRIGLPTVPIVEVDWLQYGPKLAQVALTFGANHLDRVSPADDPALGRRRATLEEVRRNITAAGFTPVGARA